MDVRLQDGGLTQERQRGDTVCLLQHKESDFPNRVKSPNVFHYVHKCGESCWFVSTLFQIRLVSCAVILALLQSQKNWQD